LDIPESARKSPCGASAMMSLDENGGARRSAADAPARRWARRPDRF